MDCVFSRRRTKAKQWVQHTITVYPSGYINSGFGYATNPTNGYTAANSTTYASFQFQEDNVGRQFAYYTFDLNAIPLDAVIDSVSCSATANVYQNTVKLSGLGIQMYTGTTAKGSSSTPTKNKTTFTLNTGTWTASEIRNARIALYGYKDTDSSSYPRYYYFYGATLTVTYSALE